MKYLAVRCSVAAVTFSKFLAPQSDIKESPPLAFVVMCPFVIASIFVNTKRPGVDRRDRIAGDDDRDVPTAGDHGVAAIRVALSRASGMCMHVRHNRQSGFSTTSPEICKSRAWQDANAAAVGAGVQFVIKDEVPNLASLPPSNS